MNIMSGILEKMKGFWDKTANARTKLADGAKKLRKPSGWVAKKAGKGGWWGVKKIGKLLWLLTKKFINLLLWPVRNPMRAFKFALAGLIAGGYYYSKDKSANVQNNKQYRYIPQSEQAVRDEALLKEEPRAVYDVIKKMSFDDMQAMAAEGKALDVKLKSLPNIEFTMTPSDATSVSNSPPFGENGFNTLEEFKKNAVLWTIAAHDPKRFEGSLDPRPDVKNPNDLSTGARSSSVNEGEKSEKKNEGAEIDPKKQARIEKQKEIARRMGIPYTPVDDFSHINTKGKGTSVDAATKTDSGSKQAVQTKVIKKEEATEEESKSKPSSFYNEPGSVKLLVVRKGDKSSVYVVTDGAHLGGDLAWKKYPLSSNLKIPEGFEKAVAQFIKQDVDEALTNEGRWAERAAEKKTNEAIEDGAEKAWDGSKKAAEEGKSLLLDAVEYGKEVLDEKFPDKDAKKDPSVKEAPAKGDSEGALKSMGDLGCNSQDRQWGRTPAARAALLRSMGNLYGEEQAAKAYEQVVSSVQEVKPSVPKGNGQFPTPKV